MQPDSSETLIGWKSGKTTYVLLWDRLDPDSESGSGSTALIESGSETLGIISVADPDPGSGAFLTHGSRISDPKPIFFESLVTIFWLKNPIIL
jgi:hypothetical protein